MLVALITVILLAPAITALTERPAAADPGDGLSINTALCENGGNRILEHEGQLPVFVCFDDVNDTLTVRNQAPYWLNVGLPDGLQLRDRNVAGVEGIAVVALTQVIGTDGRVIAPGAEHIYDVLFNATTYSPTFVFSTEMYEAELLFDSIMALGGAFVGKPLLAAQAAAVGMNSVYGLAGADLGDLGADLALETLVGLDLLAAESATTLLATNPTAQQLATTTSGLGAAIATAWTINFVLTIAEILLQNIDYADALDTYDQGALTIHSRVPPLPAPPSEWVHGPAPTNQCATEVVADYQQIHAAALSPKATIAAVLYGPRDTPTIATFNVLDGSEVASSPAASLFNGSPLGRWPLAVSDYGHVAVSRDDHLRIADPSLNQWFPVSPGRAATTTLTDVRIVFDGNGQLYFSKSGPVTGFDDQTLASPFRYDPGSQAIEGLLPRLTPDGDTHVADITPDGGVILLQTRATNIPGVRPTVTTTSQMQLVAYDRTGNTFEEASFFETRSAAANLFPVATVSDDAARSLWGFQEYVYRTELVGTLRRLNFLTNSTAPSLSGDGAAVAYGHSGLGDHRTPQVLRANSGGANRAVIGPAYALESRQPFGTVSTAAEGLSFVLASSVGDRGVDVLSLDASECTRSELPPSTWDGVVDASPAIVTGSPHQRNMNGAHRPWNDFGATVNWPSSNFRPITIVDPTPTGGTLYYYRGTSLPQSGWGDLYISDVEFESCGDDCVRALVTNAREIASVQNGGWAVPNHTELYVQMTNRYPGITSNRHGGSVVRLRSSDGQITKYITRGKPWGIGLSTAFAWDVDNGGRYFVRAEADGERKLHPDDNGDLMLFDMVTDRARSITSLTGSDPGSIRGAAFGNDHSANVILYSLDEDTSTVYSITSPNGPGGPDPVNGDRNGDGRVRIAIIGDSYIAGEGAFEYVTGTDVAGASIDGSTVKTGNKCHQAQTSWAYIVALELAGSADDIGLFACSGARGWNLWSTPQYTGELGTQRERLIQFNAAGEVDIIFFSVGGNDAEFGSLIQACLALDCLVEELNEFGVSANNFRQRIEDAQTNATAALKIISAAAPAATIFHMGYPNPVKPQVNVTCAGLGVPVGARSAASALIPGWADDAVLFLSDGLTIDYEEQDWIDRFFVPELNTALHVAAAQGGAIFVNPVDWLAGGEICQTPPYFNGLAPGDDIAGVFGNESFHPNIAGHAVWAARFIEDYVTVGVGAGPEPEDGPEPESSLRVSINAEGQVVQWNSSGQIIISNGEPGTELQLELHSLPRILSRIVLDTSGGYAGEFTIPFGIQPGLHELIIRPRDGSATVLNGTWILVDGEPRCNSASVVGADADGDSVADFCDPDNLDGPEGDADFDAVDNHFDNCPLTPNTDQADGNSDGIGDACVISSGGEPINAIRTTAATSFDIDEDGIPNTVDNCPLDPNTDQADGEGDGIGDACDDLVAPLVEGSLATPLNQAGWSNNPDQAVEWAATDPSPSFGGPDPSSAVSAQLTEGVITYESPEFCDAQGNCAIGSLEIPLDLSPPIIELNSPADGSTIHIRDYIAPSCASTDDLSGPNGECALSLRIVLEDAESIVYEATASGADLAGNSATVTATFTVVLDVEAPTIAASPDRPANAAGWWEGPVTWTFVCSDPSSGVATCPAPVTFSVDGANQSQTVSATDNAGNEATLLIAGVNIDSIAPVISFIGGATSYGVSDTIEIDCVAGDELSGIATADCPDISAQAFEHAQANGGTPTGSFIIEAIVTDLAGNTTQQTLVFSVEASSAGLMVLVEQWAAGTPGFNGLANHVEQEDFEAFIAQVAAKCCRPDKKNKTFTAEQARTLTAIAMEVA